MRGLENIWEALNVTENSDILYYRKKTIITDVQRGDGCRAEESEMIEIIIIS